MPNIDAIIAVLDALAVAGVVLVRPAAAAVLRGDVSPQMLARRQLDGDLGLGKTRPSSQRGVGCQSTPADGQDLDVVALQVLDAADQVQLRA